MIRSLEEVANATPADYLTHVPTDAIKMAFYMIGQAQTRFPIPNRDDGQSRMQDYKFLYVGPGSGLVIQTLIQQGHSGFGLETSRRGIRFGSPDDVRNYVLWNKPWETPFATKDGVTGAGLKPFHVGVISAYMKELLTPQEWQETVKEVQKVCRYVSIYNPDKK